jgi:pimeloyl-ACP methyl ester carboxylesterase
VAVLALRRGVAPAQPPDPKENKCTPLKNPLYYCYQLGQHIESKMTQPPATRVRRFAARNLLWRIARIAALSYLGVVLIISMLQERLIFPGHTSQGQKYAVIQPSTQRELIPLTTSMGDHIYVLFSKATRPNGLPHADAAARPTIIFFYGNAMCLSDAIGFAHGWQKIGANVLVIEYPGYGMSSGKPGEKPFYAAADAAYDYLLTRPDIDKNKIISAGLSIGCGVAVDLASRKPVAGLALFAPFTSLDDIARITLPWFPTRLLLRHHFNNLKKIADLDMPILIAHGTYDTIIPVEMSYRLAHAAAKAQVKTAYVKTDHNDLFDTAGDKLGKSMANFVNQIATTKPSS